MPPVVAIGLLGEPVDGALGGGQRAGSAASEELSP
jgi:hypothetical protein